MYVIIDIGIDIFGIFSKSGGPKQVYLSISLLILHYPVEKLCLIWFSNKFIMFIEIWTNNWFERFYRNEVRISTVREQNYFY